MFRRSLLGALALIALSATVARADPKDDLQSAIKKLSDAPNYSWTVTTDSQFAMGPTDGKTEKGGYTTYTLSQFQSTNQVVAKGDKLAVKLEDGWKSGPEIAKAAADAAAGGGGGMGFAPETFLNTSVQNLRTPAAEAQELVDKIKDIKKTENVYAADLTPAIAKDLLMNRRPGAPATTAPAGGFAMPDPTDPKGSVKFTLKDGQLAKFEVHLSGGFNFGGQETPIDRTNTTEFKDVGTTKITVPDEAKAKLNAAASPATTPAKP